MAAELSEQGGLRRLQGKCRVTSMQGKCRVRVRVRRLQGKCRVTSMLLWLWSCVLSRIGTWMGLPIGLCLVV